MSQSTEASGNPLRCVLLQASGKLKILTVPFHCALRYPKSSWTKVYNDCTKDEFTQGGAGMLGFPH